MLVFLSLIKHCKIYGLRHGEGEGEGVTLAEGMFIFMFGVERASKKYERERETERKRERGEERERLKSNTAEDHALQKTDEGTRHVSRIQVSFNTPGKKTCLNVHGVCSRMGNMD